MERRTFMGLVSGGLVPAPVAARSPGVKPGSVTTIEIIGGGYIVSREYRGPNEGVQFAYHVQMLSRHCAAPIGCSTECRHRGPTRAEPGAARQPRKERFVRLVQRPFSGCGWVASQCPFLRFPARCLLQVFNT